MGMLLRRHYSTTPVTETKQAEITSKPVDTVTDSVVEETKTYTKTEINRTSKEDLVELAKKYGIDEELSGAEIKKALIDKLGL